MADVTTELLYLGSMDAAYRKEFDASIARRGENYLVLDKTLFYPEGGGQEHDTGILRHAHGDTKVLRVEKKGIVKHIVDALPPADTVHVHGLLDWDRRFANMRMHTAQHLVSGIAYDLFGGARTVGNQLHPDRSRIDFRPAKFSDADLHQLETETNRILAKGLPVDLKFESRTSLERRVKPDRANLDLLPKHINELRVVEIGDVDACPCGGTHVRNLGEIGKVRILGKSSKGAETVRVEYELAAP
ncbi:MAG: alanyl-tRNA editing protein [Euryarchaeota archaeon]|nr:alanyl-tRNA editing protein [Euryarchaeota archaeon]